MTGAGFIMLPYAVHDSPEFKKLEHIDVRVLLLLIHRHNGHNNGDIALGVREVVAECRCSQGTAWRALNRLQQAGFITETHKGHLVSESGRPNVASRWRINFLTDASKPSRNSGNSHQPEKDNGRTPAVLK